MAFKDFWEQNHYLKVEQKLLPKWGSFDNLLFQNEASVISKWGRERYFEECHCLFQSGAKVMSKRGCYFKVEQRVILKRGSYFNVGHLF